MAIPSFIVSCTTIIASILLLNQLCLKTASEVSVEGIKEFLDWYSSFGGKALSLFPLSSLWGECYVIVCMQVKLEGLLLPTSMTWALV